MIMSVEELNSEEAMLQVAPISLTRTGNDGKRTGLLGIWFAKYEQPERQWRLNEVKLRADGQYETKGLGHPLDDSSLIRGIQCTEGYGVYGEDLREAMSQFDLHETADMVQKFRDLFRNSGVATISTK